MSPELVALWGDVLVPLVGALAQHATVEQLGQLREAAWRLNHPQALTIDLLWALRVEIDRPIETTPQ